MSRLLSSTFSSSICLLVFFHLVWLLLLTTATAKPAGPNSAGNQHISSFVNQTSKARSRQEFDFERNEAEATNSVHLQQLFGGLLQLPTTRLDDALDNSLPPSDDAPVTARNQLDDELQLDMVSEQHEGATLSPDEWHRIKLNIPVLEPVKHLVNAVGGGGVNDTHVRNNHHRLVGHHGVHHSTHHGENSSMAIETEEDRETAIESTGFDVLETLGTTGTVLWGFLQNLRTVFAASAGTASSASSGGGGGGGGAAGNK